MVPSVVFDVPKSSPQIDMSAPKGASVYPFTRHRSTFILARGARSRCERYSYASRHALKFVMAGLVPAIHVLNAQRTWMAGINPAMTRK
jgi:hypothetical protein